MEKNNEKNNNGKSSGQPAEKSLNLLEQEIAKTPKTENPKNFLFVTNMALNGDLAWQLKKEGHQVKKFISEPFDADVYDGILDKVDDWKVNIDWADVIVFDETRFGRRADILRKQGKLVVGCSVYADRLEDDREFGQLEMKDAGMLVLPSWSFSSYDEAIQFIKENPRRYVFKPSGEVQDEKGLLFIGREEDGIDIIEVLEHNKKAWSKKIKNFQLQKFASGVEVAVGAFFNGEDFITPINVNFEHKKLFPGDIGPPTGEMGTLMYWSEPNAIFNATLVKMKDKLRECKYVGYIDVNCIVNQRGIYPLEFTARFGYPTISIQMEGVMGGWGGFLYGLAKGEKPELRARKGFQVGVVVAIPPFPYQDEEEIEIYKDASILFKKSSLDGVHFGDVKFSDGDLHLAGVTGYALVITGSGNTVDEARGQAYRRIQNIMLQNMFYRTDIGLKWNEDSDKLQTWGYLR